MDSLSFLNPMLLWGLALASIPLIIHLLFRRKFRRVEWAPMRYLKLSIQKNRQRIRLEQLLLLLLRTLAIMLLFFLVARPLLNASGLGNWLSGRSRASQILVIDDSLSMGYLDAGRSALDRAQDLAVSVIAARRGPGSFHAGRGFAAPHAPGSRGRVDRYRRSGQAGPRASADRHASSLGKSVWPRSTICWKPAPIRSAK